jgi:hypothetical protein
MPADFKPEMFLKRMLEGEFDGRLSETLEKLSADQLEQVVVLFLKHSRQGKSGGALSFAS